jgi:hypothetical protein
MIRLTFIFSLLLSLSVFAQENYTISGTLTDGSSGEALIGARVQLQGEAKGALTNVYGFYSLTLPAGTHEIVFSYVGFEKQIKTVELNQDVSLSFELAVAAKSIKEFVVEGESQVESMDMSKDELGIEQIKSMPALMGEVDVIKAIQMLPGVQTVGEGGSGFFVRGGAADQNLILLDEANVYNASHLLGFFSVFNPDAVKNVE